MTLSELFKLIRHHFITFATITLVTAVALACYAAFKPVSYTAETEIEASAKAAALPHYLDTFEKTFEGVTLSATANSSKNIATISATGKDEQQCLDAADAAGDFIISTAQEIYPKKSYTRLPAKITMNTKSNPVKYTFAGILGGMMLGAAFLAARAYKKQLVLSAEQLEDAIDLPCAVDFTVKDDRAVAQNISALFAALSKRTGQIVFVSLDESEEADTDSYLAKFKEREDGAAVRAHHAPQTVADALCLGKDASIVPLLLVREEKATLPAVKQALKLFALANIDVPAFIALPR